MATLFGKLFGKVAEALLDELAKPEQQRRSEEIRRAAKKARKRERADKAASFFVDELQRQFTRATSQSVGVQQEMVTAVLRRQVPPRDEPARSWIGGLPMLPDAIEWPRAKNSEYPEAGEIPLSFVAQIACADLPQDLWSGAGPREGWLVFFVATWGCASFDDEGSIRVFHTSELGRKRQAPADKRSVGDPNYSGGDNTALNYTGWPVDIVAFPNQPSFPSANPWAGDDLVSPIPPRFESLLYDGVTVATGLKHPRACFNHYAEGGEARASMSEDMRLGVEARLRRLEYNRPHRLGGIHQPVQDTRAPDGKVLLLQLGEDSPAGFRWGDCGAMFAWIGIEQLSRGDFSKVEWWTENT